MANTGSIGDWITDNDYFLTKYQMQEWNNIKLMLARKYVVAVKEVLPVYAEKYKFDLEGLFRDVFSIPKMYIYPHILINGFDSSQCYNGNKLRFNILDNEVVARYHKYFIRNEERLKERNS